MVLVFAVSSTDGHDRWPHSLDTGHVAMWPCADGHNHRWPRQMAMVAMCEEGNNSYYLRNRWPDGQTVYARARARDAPVTWAPPGLPISLPSSAGGACRPGDRPPLPRQPRPLLAQRRRGRDAPSAACRWHGRIDGPSPRWVSSCTERPGRSAQPCWTILLEVGRDYSRSRHGRWLARAEIRRRLAARWGEAQAGGGSNV
jgi:hypothetical protein